MKGKQRFFFCKNHCGNIVGMVDDKRGKLVCCGEPMTELVPNTVEASKEKHLPAVTASGDSVSVQVGSVIHPMEEAHHIQFIYLETEQGGQRRAFKPGDEPKHTFCLSGEKAVAVYEYCNLHGLWKVEI